LASVSSRSRKPRDEPARLAALIIDFLGERSFLELDGTGIADAESLVSEAAMRGFWQYSREIMGF
jgi:hypothetical protein